MRVSKDFTPTMRVSPIRIGVNVVAWSCFAATFLLPYKFAAIIIATALVWSALFAWLSITKKRKAWLLAGPRRDTSIQAFMRSELAHLLFVGVGVGTVLFLAIIQLPFTPELREYALRFGLFPLALALIGGALFAFRAEENLIELRSLIRTPPVAEIVRDGLAFQFKQLPAILSAATRLILFVGLVGVLGFGALAVVGFAGLYYGGSGFALFDWTSWPLLTQSAFIASFFLAFMLTFATILTLTRTIDEYRQGAFIRQKAVWNHLNEAVGHMSILPSLMMSFLGLGIFLILGFGGYGLYLHGVTAGLSVWVTVPIIAITFVFAIWFLLWLPLQWVLPLLALNDIGWMRSIEASTSFVRVEQSRAVRIAALSFLLFVSVVGIPAAIYLLLRSLDNMRPIFRVISHEITLQEARLLIEESDNETEKPKAIEEAYQAFEAGKYLKALNSFQMYLMHHPENLDAVRGESLATLSLGNIQKGREYLEKWQRLDPSNEEADRLYQELNDGHWDEGGFRYEQARANSVEQVAEGTNMRGPASSPASS